LVALKQMHPHLAKLAVYRDLFEEEARIGSVLVDPNIAQVFDFVEDRGQYYLVMEWVSGIDLATYIRYVVDRCEDRLRWGAVAAIGIGVLRGLAAAHERTRSDGDVDPIVHRDVSPHNILISDKGRAKLIDFGLSFARDRSIEDTDPGMAKGKLAYLAPEIVRGGRPTPATDQFAVGSLLWEALVGRRAFEGENDLTTYERVANAEVEPLADLRDDIPPDFARLVHRALALDPADRFASTTEMAMHLGDVLKSHQTGHDLYQLLADTVTAARADLAIGERSQDPAVEEEDPISEVLSGLVELLPEDAEPTRPAGLRRWIPKFLQKSRDNAVE
jgi:serine/threonine-protein kinase